MLTNQARKLRDRTMHEYLRGTNLNVAVTRLLQFLEQGRVLLRRKRRCSVLIPILMRRPFQTSHNRRRDKSHKPIHAVAYHLSCVVQQNDSLFWSNYGILRMSRLWKMSKRERGNE